MHVIHFKALKKSPLKKDQSKFTKPPFIRRDKCIG